MLRGVEPLIERHFDDGDVRVGKGDEHGHEHAMVKAPFFVDMRLETGGEKEVTRLCRERRVTGAG